MDRVNPAKWERNEKEQPWKSLKAEEIAEFRKSNPMEPVYLPELSKNRRCTDIVGLVITGMLFGAALGYLIYFFVINAKATEIISDNVGQCKDNEECKVLKNLEDNLAKLIGTLVGVAAITTVSMLGLYFAFYKNAYVTSWISLGFALLTLLGIAIGMWILWALFFTNSLRALILPLSATFSFFVAVIFIFCCYDRIKLAIQLIQEVMEAFFHMKILLALPLLMAILQALLTAFLINGMITFFCVFAAKEFATEEQRTRELESASNLYGSAAGFWISLFFVFLITMSIIYGVQNMIGAGALGAYYFIRDKSRLDRPVGTSVYNVFRFHFGTICTGALIITIVKILRMMAEQASDSQQNVGVAIVLCIVACCLACIEEVLEYFTRKAYIITALHGTSYCKSGLRALRLFCTFFLDNVAVSGTVSLVVFGSFAFIFAANGGICYGILTDFIENTTFRIILCIFITLFISGPMISIYDTMFEDGVEAFFMFYCEDKLMNDGSSAKPYFMSKRLEALTKESIVIYNTHRLSPEEREALGLKPEEE